MYRFTYSAIDANGSAQTGTIAARSRHDAIATLADRKLFVTRIEESAEAKSPSGAASPTRTSPESHGGAGRLSAALPGAGAGDAAGAASAGQASGETPIKRISLQAMGFLWRQIATALEAGLPLLTALQVVREQADRPAIAALAQDLAHRVETGSSFSDALAAHPRQFAPLHVSMVRAGETAGVLDQVMASLADFTDRDLDVRQRVRSAATYPVIVLVLAVLSILVILVFILPRVMSTIGQDPALLPLPTRVLMGVGDVVRGYGWAVALAAAGGAWGYRRWISTPAGRLAVDRFKLRLPLLGRMLRQVAVARFARALGTLTGSGIQVVEALGVLRDTLGNEALGQAIDQVRASVIQGQPIAQTLSQCGYFPPLFVQVVALGERTGKLPELLLRAADSFDKEVTASIQRTMTVLPALLIMGLALVVGFILAAVLLPIINMEAAMPGG